MSLDQAYGPLVPPRSWRAGRPAYEDWEAKHSPRSLNMLNSVTAPALKELMDQIASGWNIGYVLTNDTTIIWLVDAAGQIWLAIEELVLNGEPKGIPKHQTMELTARAPKLGHAALVGCANARNGGEIFFDPTRVPPNWTITNKSGRYGTQPSRTAFHLDNVVKEFSSFGINLAPRFIG